MEKLIPKCPVCQNHLQVTTLQCPNCGLTINKPFAISPFDALSPELYDFLMEFLRQQGNLSAVQQSLNISYPTAKKHLTNLLIDLNLHINEETAKCEGEDIMPILSTNNYASNLIRNKLKENNGHATVRSIKGKQYSIWFINNNQFGCDISASLNFSIFDVVTEHIISQGGRSKKGIGRANLGDPKCEENTVAGAILKNYYHKKPGETAFSPDFIVVAILEWAGIIKSGWGYVELTQKTKEDLDLYL